MLKENVFTFPVSIGSYQQFIDEIFHISERQTSSYVCFANVHMVIEGYNDPAFNAVIQQADIVTPDGSPVALFLRYFRKIRQVRVAGLDIFPDLLKEAETRGKSVYFYGTTDDILEKIAAKAKREYPALKICGLHSPPFRTLSDEEKNEVINQINNAKPDLIFVALGCPKQENWMAHHKGKINGCMLGLGHAFKVYAEISKRSPQWMQKMSLEWAYRLCQEPGRLWKRYFYTNSLFLMLMLKYSSSRNSVSYARKSSRTVYKCDYHIVWVPLARFKLLSESMADNFTREVAAVCGQHGCSLKELRIDTDFIHLKLSIPPKIPVASLVKTLKSKVTVNLFKNNPSLGLNYSGKQFWTRGNFISTDDLNEELVKRYVKFQEAEHG